MTHIYSTELAIQRGLAIKLRRAHIMAKNGGNSDFNTNHPDEKRDAQNKNYTKLDIRIKKEFDLAQKRNTDRRTKLGERV